MLIEVKFEKQRYFFKVKFENEKSEMPERTHRSDSNTEASISLKKKKLTKRCDSS